MFNQQWINNVNMDNMVYLTSRFADHVGYMAKNPGTLMVP